MPSTIGSDNVYSGGITYSTPAFIFGSTGDVNGGYSFDLPLATVAAFSNQGLNFLADNSNNARGFFSTIQKDASASLSRTENAAFRLANSGLGTLRSISMHSISTQERINALTQVESTKRVEAMPKPDSGWCFITTAVCEAENLPDDCEALTVLRQFRDDFMIPDESLKMLVKQYYDVAPGIVDKLKSFADGGQFAFAYLKAHYIEPAIDAVKRGDNQSALSIYAAMVEFAMELSE